LRVEEEDVGGVVWHRGGRFASLYGAYGEYSGQFVGN
jgi:hypothetical protein